MASMVATWWAAKKIPYLQADVIPGLAPGSLFRARHNGVLYSDVELEFDHLGVVTVGAVMADPDRYAGETLADPMEGVEYGRCKAKVMRGDDGALFIHSFAHSRCIYHLRHDLRSAKAAFEKIAGASVDDAVAILAQVDLEDDEVDEFAKFVGDRTKVGIRAVRARFPARHWLRVQARGAVPVLR
jgi:hypothetical protein